MKTHLAVKLASFALAATLLALGGQALAWSPPPQIPAVFNADTVKNLVAHIDEGQNLMIVEMGMLMHRGFPDFQKAECYAVLRDAAKQEKVGSKRWLLVESARAFDGPVLGDDTRAEGMAAYGEIMDHWQDAVASGGQDILLHDFSFMVPAVANGACAPMLPGVADPEGQLVSRAFAIYLQVLAKSPGASEQIRWSLVADRDPNMATEADKALADPATPKNYALYKAAADAHAGKDPASAVSLLVKAEPLAAGDAKQTTALYTQLVDLLLVLKEDDHAIIAQKDLIAKTGAGRGRLAMIYRDEKDDADYQAELKALEVPDAPEADVLDLAGRLVTAARNTVGSPMWSEAAAVLNAYIGRTTPRNIVSDLRARVLLVQVLTQLGKTADAAAVIAAAPKPGPGQEEAEPPYFALQRYAAHISPAITSPQVTHGN